jgi:eukaryotic-like serine/threonine-protein kinase
MNSPGDEPTIEMPTPDEARLFEFLERYLNSVHSGDLASRSVLIERHPELAQFIRCIELLDRLAPDAPAVKAERPAAEHKPATPQPFGKYELLEEIGRGGMGVVFRARQTDLDRNVAIKMILSSRLASADDVGRFHAEAKAAGSLRHPNIVAIHDAGEVHGQHFFAMDYVEGRSLAQALANGPFEPRLAAQCMASIGQAVQYLHEHHIIHRDLKPSNILLAPDGTPYVTDFGLAKALAFDSPHTQTGTMVGTLGYMAPEQTLGESGSISPRSDVYSLGAILFELLTGRPPFQNASPFDTLMQVMEEDPPRPRKLNRSVPLSLEWICLKCLEKQPRNRYQSAAGLVEDLERFLRGEPLIDAAPGPVRSLIRWSRREPALATHLGAIAVSTGILQLKYMVSGADPPYHLMVMSVFGAWALIAMACCWLMRQVRIPDLVQYAWAAADAGFLSLLIYVTPVEKGQYGAGPLLVGYPLLIVASGQFFRVRLVTFMTAACLLAYGALVAIGREPIIQPQYTLIYAAALGVIGFVVGYQAYRVRILSAYFQKDDSRLTSG